MSLAPPADTDPKAWQVWVELHRRMPAADKLRHVLEASEMQLRLYEAGVRHLYPNANEREVFLRTAARHLDRETMIKVYGWDPESNDPPR